MKKRLFYAHLSVVKSHLIQCIIACSAYLPVVATDKSATPVAGKVIATVLRSQMSKSLRDGVDSRKPPSTCTAQQRSHGEHGVLFRSGGDLSPIKSQSIDTVTWKVHLLWVVFKLSCRRVVTPDLNRPYWISPLLQIRLWALRANQRVTWPQNSSECPHALGFDLPHIDTPSRCGNWGNVPSAP